jgi:hypothetical protein
MHPEVFCNKGTASRAVHASKERWALQAAEKLIGGGFVKGHD